MLQNYKVLLSIFKVDINVISRNAKSSNKVGQAERTKWFNHNDAI